MIGKITALKICRKRTVTGRRYTPGIIKLSLFGHKLYTGPISLKLKVKGKILVASKFTGTISIVFVKKLMIRECTHNYV